jgi:hypothetical protein
MTIWVAPTGKIVHGSVLDCARRPLEAKLREYDPQLYVRWNPKKLRGVGCWELRRRPEFKSIREEDVCVYGGNTYVYPKYHENGFDNHLKDFAFLNYSMLGWLQANDQWKASDRAKNYVRDLEYKEGKIRERIMSKADSEKSYMIKQNKVQIRAFKEYLLSGGNPHNLANVWNDA